MQFNKYAMNIRKQTRYAALIISILSASLLNEYILKLLKSYYEEPTYQSVAIGMLITVLIFVPIVSFLGKWVGKASKTYLLAGKTISASRTRGLYISFVIALAILFVLYAKYRHGMDILARLGNMF